MTKLEAGRRALKLAFVGGGANSAVGYTHYVASRMDGAFEIVAGCFSKDEEVNRQSALRANIDQSRIYATPNELFRCERGKVDAVCILTPTPSHYEHVMDALANDHSVICEKAMAASVDEAKEMVEVARKSGKFFGVTFNYAGYPMVREARAIIHQGLLGEVRHVICEMPQETFARHDSNPQPWRRLDYEIPCVSLDLGVHVHHLVRYLAGSIPLEGISATYGTHGRFHDIVDTVTVTAKSDSNPLINLFWGKACLGQRNGLNIRVFGDQGSLMWNQTDPETLWMADKSGAVRQLDRGLSIPTSGAKFTPERFKAGHPAGFVEAFANLYTDFADGLAGNSQALMEVSAHFGADVALEGLQFLEEVGRAAS